MSGRIVNRRRIHDGRIVSFSLIDVQVESGETVTREVVEREGTAVMVAFDDEGRMLWTRQHRYPMERRLLELPAGRVEHGEEPEATARRELVEELGVSASSWERLGGFYTTPAFCTEYVTAFVATELTPASAPGDVEEDIEVVGLTVDEALAAIDRGEVEDGRSLAVLMLYLRRQGRVE